MIACATHFPECDGSTHGCGSPCGRSYYATPGEPCWGRVEVVGEDYYEDAPELTSWIYACEGHADELAHGQAYVREPSCAGARS